jgi:hypothetical protein
MGLSSVHLLFQHTRANLPPIGLPFDHSQKEKVNMRWKDKARPVMTDIIYRWRKIIWIHVLHRLDVQSWNRSQNDTMRLNIVDKRPIMALGENPRQTVVERVLVMSLIMRGRQKLNGVYALDRLCM